MVTACQSFDHKDFMWLVWEFYVDSPFPVCSLTLLLIFTTPDELLIKLMRQKFEEVMFHFTAFAPKCKMIHEWDTESHVRHIPFSVPTHTQRLTKDSHNTGNFMPCSFRIVCAFFNIPQWS